MIIYKVTNSIIGKIYIGQTTKTPKQRLAKHWSEAHVPSRPNNYFHNALLKYGIKDLRSIGMAVCGKTSKKELLKYLKNECENVRCTGLN